MFVQLVIEAMTTAPWPSRAVAFHRHGVGAACSSDSPKPRSLGGSLQRPAERPLHVAQRHAVLRPLRAGQARLDRGQVELQHLGVVRLRRVGRRGQRAEQVLLLRVAFDQFDLGVGAAGFAEIGQRLLVDGEEAHRGAVFGRHVGHQGPVGHLHLRQGRPEELDELVDHALGAEDLRHGEHQVGGGGAGRQLAGKLEADHLGGEHVERLAEHDRLGLDSADAPADHAQAVDHRRVAVGAHQRVGQRHRPRRVLAQARRTSPGTPG